MSTQSIKTKIPQLTQIISGALRNVVNGFLIDRRTRALSPRTIEFYQLELKYFAAFLDKLGVIQLAEIDADVIRKFLLDLSQHRNAGGVHAGFRCVHALFIWAWDEYDIETKNPIRKVRPPTPSKDPIPGISLEDFRAIVATCDNTQCGIRDKALLYFLLDSGIRAGESTALNLGDVDLQTRSAVILHGKGNKRRLVYYGQKTAKELRKYLKTRPGLAANSPLFATRQDTRLTYDGLRDIVRRRAHDANVEEPGLHDFRRACGLALHRNGASLLDIGRLLGHSSTEVTKRYVCIDETDLRDSHAKSSPVDRM